MSCHSLYVHTALRQLSPHYKDQLQHIGIAYCHQPAFNIKPFVDAKPACKSYDYAIFLSIPAAQLFRHHLLETICIKKYFCIGHSTQKALGLTDQVAEPPYGSEMLLRKLEQQQLRDKKILVVCGKNPRLLAIEALQKKSRYVEVLHNYQRIANNHFLQAIPLYPLQHIFFSAYSIEAAKLLKQQLNQNSTAAKVVVLEGRVYNFADSQGFLKLIAIPYLAETHLFSALNISTQQYH